MKKIAIALVMVMGMSGQVMAEDYGTDQRDIAVSTSLLAGWATAVSVLPGSVVAEYGAIAPFLFGLVAGPIREWQTDPAKRGLFAYNGQADSLVSENRKWESDPSNKRWKRLKGYASNENEVARLAQMAQADLEASDAKKYR